MTPSRLLVVFVGLLWCASAAAGPLTMRGRIGTETVRQDRWAPSDHGGVTDWRFMGSLALAQTLFRPGVFAWNASVSYGAADSRQTTFRDKVQIAANAAALSRLNWPTTLSVRRQWTSFLSDPDSDTGRTISTQYGAFVARTALSLPAVWLAIQRSRDDNIDPLGNETYSAATTLRTGLNHRARDGSGYSLYYGTGWHDGTFVVSNYRDHNFSANYDTNVEALDEGSFQLRARYRLRQPTDDGPVNLRVDSNQLDGRLSWRVGEDLHRTRYQYAQRVISSPTIEATRITTHSTSWTMGRHLSRRLRTGLGFSFGYSEEAQGDKTLRGAGNNVGASVGYIGGAPELGYSAFTSGSVGLATPGPELRVGYSGTQTFQVHSSRPKRILSAAYSLSLGSGSVGLDEWSMEQTVHAAVDVRSGHPYRADIRVRAKREERALVGTSVSRSAQSTMHTRVGGRPVQLRLSLSEAVEGSLQDPVGDGLVFPAEFNSRRYDGELSVPLEVGPLTVRTYARSAWSDSPGRPLTWEHGVGLQTAYAYGLLLITLEEQFSVGGSDDQWRAGNRVYLTVQRLFSRRGS